MNRSTKQLRFENLESRRLLAGNVTVVETDNLYIRGDDFSNQIQIVADQSGQIIITGQNNTTINGSLAPYFVAESENLNGARGRNASFDGSLYLFTDDGDDRIVIRGIEFGKNSRINTGHGDDFVRINRSTAKDDLVVGAGEGDDMVILFQARARGDLKLNTHNGNDTIRMHNSRTWGDTNLVSGADHDHIRVVRSRFTGDSQRISARDGRDLIEFKRNAVNESGIVILAGHDRDQIFATMGRNDEINGDVILNGQQGFDTLSVKAGAEMSARVLASGFELEGKVVFDNGAGGVEGVTYAVNSFFESPIDNHRVASDFQVDNTQAVRKITWTGSYGGDLNDPAPEPFEVDEFTIEFFEGNSIVPIGEPIATFEVGDDVNRVETGVIVGASQDIEIFSYAADIDVLLEAGKTYWVSIYSAVEDEIVQGTSVWGHYNTFRWGMRSEYLYELAGTEIQEATAYTYGDRVTTNPGWDKTNGGVYDFQLWS